MNDPKTVILSRDRASYFKVGGGLTRSLAQVWGRGWNVLKGVSIKKSKLFDLPVINNVDTLIGHVLVA